MTENLARVQELLTMVGLPRDAAERLAQIRHLDLANRVLQKAMEIGRTLSTRCRLQAL